MTPTLFFEASIHRAGDKGIYNINFVSGDDPSQQAFKSQTRSGKDRKSNFV